MEEAEPVSLKINRASPPPPIKRQSTYPIVPVGEDETSFQRHNLKIQVELKKTRPNHWSLLLSLITSHCYSAHH